MEGEGTIGVGASGSRINSGVLNHELLLRGFNFDGLQENMKAKIRMKRNAPMEGEGTIGVGASGSRINSGVLNHELLLRGFNFDETLEIKDPSEIALLGGVGAFGIGYETTPADSNKNVQYYYLALKFWCQI
ncbi:unnamed protein product [Lupinus luteus]|uniref:Uncharacterized protein n=1 Tax=Lupinus luteus TaxID=3873 RepID=A0AAV1YAQ2_LUPLU